MRAQLAGRILVAGLMAGAAAPGRSAAQEPPRPCRTPEYRQFDFWLGEWDVETPDGKRAGGNRLTSIYDGCAIREEWQSSGRHAGTSLNFYDKKTGKWHQTWIANDGGALYLNGGIEDGSMVLRSAEGASPLHRITWSRLDGGRVRQLWEASKDGGKTWSVAFDGTYIPKS
jgi:hypothetical protein